jgi:hypothetical protein
MQIRPDRDPRLPIGAAIMLGVAVLAAGIPFIMHGRAVTPVSHTASTAATKTPGAQPAAKPADAASSQAAPVATSPVASVPQTAPSPATTPRPAPAPVTAKPRVTAAQAGPSVEAYRGLGTWVDIYDDRAWNDPASAVRNMAGHGVRTLYLETGNSRAPSALKDPAKLATFIRSAHANHMRVVAWYLPDLQKLSLDYDRVSQAIRFTTSDGQKFDSFALDIESSKVANIGARNQALTTLTSKIRHSVGKSYALGAIIPSPVGISKDYGPWPSFPYSMLAQNYDVFLPMSYYTWHGSGGAAALADTLANVRIIRSQKGCANTPIHPIGGLAENSTPSEVRAFLRAEHQTGCIGAGLYGWSGTTTAGWQQLSALRP